MTPDTTTQTAPTPAPAPAPAPIATDLLDARNKLMAGTITADQYQQFLQSYTPPPGATPSPMDAATAQLIAAKTPTPAPTAPNTNPFNLPVPPTTPTTPLTTETAPTTPATASTAPSTTTPTGQLTQDQIDALAQFGGLDVANSTPAQEQIFANLIQQTYGITFNGSQMSLQPQKTVTELAADIMHNLNVPAQQQTITDLQSKIEGLANERDGKIASINENPFISDSNRVQQIRRVTEDYQGRIDNANISLQTAQNSYNQAVDDAKYAVSQALDIYQKGQQTSQDAIDRIINNAQNKAQQKAAEATQARQDIQTQIENALKEADLNRKIAETNANIQLKNAQTSKAYNAINKANAKAKKPTAKDITNYVASLFSGYSPSNPSHKWYTENVVIPKLAQKYRAQGYNATVALQKAKTTAYNYRKKVFNE